MPFDEARFEAHAMKTEELNQQADPIFGVDIDAIGAALSMDRAETREYARHLEALGWAKCLFSATPPRLTLTPLGYREIRKLRLPAWRRWLGRNLPIIIAIAALIVSVTTLVVSLLK